MESLVFVHSRQLFQKPTVHELLSTKQQTETVRD